MSVLYAILIVGSACASGWILSWAMEPIDVDAARLRAANFMTGQLAPGWPRRFHILRWWR